MQLPIEKKCMDENDTAILAEEFSQFVEDGDIVVLTGNLGTGKTFFVKNVLKSLGIKNVTSPSFSIVNEYQGSKKVYHFDFYRLKKQNELTDIGFQDYINDFESIIFIEWGEMFPDMLPQSYIEIKIEKLGGTVRKFTIEKNE